MIALSSATRVFVSLDPVDCRKSFSGLQGLVQDQLRQDPFSGHVFVFTNRTRNRLKLFYWDGSGIWIATKRLERGRFNWPRHDQLRPEEFQALVCGLEVVRQEGWYRK